MTRVPSYSPVKRVSFGASDPHGVISDQQQQQPLGACWKCRWADPPWDPPSHVLRRRAQRSLLTKPWVCDSPSTGRSLTQRVSDLVARGASGERLEN